MPFYWNFCSNDELKIGQDTTFLILMTELSQPFCSCREIVFDWHVNYHQLRFKDLIQIKKCGCLNAADQDKLTAGVWSSVKVQISQQGVFSYAALCRFLTELCINLLIQKYLPAWDCNIYFSCHYPEVTLPSLSSTDLLFRTFNVNVTSATVIIFCISSMKDQNVITHQYQIL